MDNEQRNIFSKARTSVDSENFGLKRRVTLENDQLTINRTQNIDGIMSHNKSMRDGKQDKDIRKVASIPLLVVDAWRGEGFDVIKRTMHGDKMGKKAFEMEMKKRLNDPKNSFLRASKGIA